MLLHAGSVFEHEQVREQALVGERRLAIDPGGLVQGPIARDPGGVERQRFEVAPQQIGVAPAGEGFDIPREQLAQIPLQPRPSGELGGEQGGIRIAAAQRKLQVAQQIGRIARCREGLEISVGEPVEKRLSGQLADHLPHGQPVHLYPHHPARSWPRLGFEVRSDAAGQQKAPGAGAFVNGPLDRAEHARHRLPLIEQHRRRERPQRGVGVGAERLGLGLDVEAHHRTHVAPRSRRLPGGAGASDEQRRQLGEELLQASIGKARHIARSDHNPLPYRFCEGLRPAFAGQPFPLLRGRGL